jgi:hypothetical protein
MSTSPPVSAGEYEFGEAQNQLIGSLARKMSLVGFVMTFFGLLQIFNGVSSLFISRNPDNVLGAAEKAGMSADQLAMLKQALAGGFWSSPLTISAIAFALAGLFLLFVGIWTRQAAGGFAGIVMTKGKDISRLMDALGALHRKYGMIYAVMLGAAIVSLVSLGISLWHSWRGGA